MKTINVLIGISMTFFMSCGDKDIFKSGSSTESTDSAQVRAESLTADATSLIIIPLTEPNKYKVVISWPKNSGNIKVLANTNVLFQTSGKISSFEHLVDSGLVLNYEVQQTAPDGTVITQIQRNIIIPKDLVISEKIVLQEDLTFTGGRLFLLNKAKIQTGTFNLKIKVDEFISDEALIETFDNSVNKLFEQSGSSAGNVTISAKMGHGSLTVYMRGIDGGSGRGSWCIPGFRVFCNASSGGNAGSSGFFALNLDSNENFIFNHTLEPAKGGIAGIACAYPQVSGFQAQPYMIYGYESNCMGFGHGANNGSPGANGNGQLCYKLNKEDAYVCD